jgi:cation:H+ antiporter
MIRTLAFLSTVAAGVALTPHGSWVDFLWSAPLIIFAAFLIAWGAEAMQFMVSQGLALALLAWLQTLPEFAVEADIAWNAARGTPGYSDHLVTANFTGSIRLLMGFGMPTVYFIRAAMLRKSGRATKAITLDPFHSVEIVSLFAPTVYFFFIVYRGRLDLLDAVILLGFYVMYMWLLLRMPPEEEDESVEELPWVSRQVLKRGRIGRVAGVTGIFLGGGVVLYLCVHPFVNSLQALALMVGIEGYFFIQWIAPFMSEFPEKVSAYSWAMKEGKAKLGLMNFLSSNINQMTMLVAMIPIVYCISSGKWTAAIVFTPDQKEEVLLTASQAALVMVLLFNMKFEWWEAVGIFVMWFVQFTSVMWETKVGLPLHTVRHYSIFANLGWTALEIFLAMLKIRRWDFPFRMGKAASRVPHNAAALDNPKKSGT